jgi:hypothetical protein
MTRASEHDPADKLFLFTQLDGSCWAIRLRGDQVFFGGRNKVALRVDP